MFHTFHKKMKNSRLKGHWLLFIYIILVMNLSILTTFMAHFYSKETKTVIHEMESRGVYVEHHMFTEQLGTPALITKCELCTSCCASMSPKRVPPPMYKFSNYDVTNREKFLIQDDDNVYFQTVQKVTCFIEGTNWELTLRDGKCRCLEQWYGQDCGIPNVIWKSRQVPVGTWRRRSKPRRVINAINVNHEFEMMQGRVHELGDAVDVYLIGESNYTAHGDTKSLNFLAKFQRGFLRKFQKKFVYVFQNVFSTEGRNHGLIEDDFQREFLSTKGLKRLQGLRQDDIYLQSDVDEIPKREVILFLKLYENYVQPIGLSLTWTVFGFFWTSKQNPSTVVGAACSIRMLETNFDMDATNLRKSVSTYPQSSLWIIGTAKIPAGWHCSWCFQSPQGIRTKLLSAPNSDKPRWGNYPEKANLSYLKKLIRTGTWFDNVTVFQVRIPTHDYAPKYFFQHVQRYSAILFHPVKGTFKSNI